MRNLSMLNVSSLVLALAGTASAEPLNFTYLWHLEQPIYWPDRLVTGTDRTERAWESILRKDAGAFHPTNNLRDIFGLADRVAAYQYRPRDAVNAIRWTPRGGAQVSYSGGLIENITSLGNAGQLGYGNGWMNPFREARNWTTAGGKPRLDIVMFGFHHPLMPLLDESTMRKSVQLYKAAYSGVWGTNPGQSRGFFPSEMAFSTRMIPVLASEGIAWSFVSAEKISRACADFPVIFGSGGVNCDPPNKADQLNPAQGGAGAYYRVSISRGCAPAEAFPYSLTPRRAQYVNPETGAVSQIIVVPCSQSLGWKDGYAPLGLSDFNTLQTRNDNARPMLVVLAHDGDNAWGGGYSYYQEATPNLVSSANSAGYVATTVEQYLTDHPVPGNDVVHVEDGAWVNADGDFGSPQMLNWNWPPVSSTGKVDIPNGWAEDIRNWAVITAAQNVVDTAEQISTGQGQPVVMSRVLNPDGNTTGTERAWHYFLASLNSGYMYYGTAEDFEVKPTIACNEAIRCAMPVVNSGTDNTAPTIWIPQRYPWNPGSVNFGPLHGYQQRINNGDFWIWTFAHDVSGMGSVTLKYRIDDDGVRNLNSPANDTYAGGPGVGAWQSVSMTSRPFPTGNVYNNPTIDFFELPQQIATQYHTQLTGIRSKLIDYYIEAVDSRGNVRKSPIQHVYVGDGSGGSPGGPVVTVNPATPVAGQPVTITYDATGRVLAGASTVAAHIGFNGWSSVITPDPAMTLTSGKWSCTISIPSTATALDLAFNNGNGTWDNNSGADWHFTVTGGQPGQNFVMDGVLDSGTTLIAQNGGMWLRAALRNGKLYLACPDAGEGNDHFIVVGKPPTNPGSMQAAFWGKGGQVARWDLFLADENDNGYVSWFNAAGTSTTANVQASTAANGGVLEGVIDLVAQFGSIPDSIAAAVALFPTANASSLAYQFGVPVSSDANANLNPGDFVTIPLCSLTQAGCCAADFNGDTSLDFFDYLDFVAAFSSNSASADFNADTVIDFFDYLDFVAAFSVGC
jgi:hypothetical protein